MKIDPTRLKAIRKGRKLTIAALAERSGVSVRSIKKYESPSEGKSSQPNQRTIEELCKTLNVERGHLTGELDLPSDLKKTEGKPTRRSVSLRFGRKQELELIHRVYGLKPEQVINMAPFLFVLLAEGSLKWRRSKLKGIENALDDCRDINHLSFLWESIHDFSEYMDLEHSSINQRDILGNRLFDFDVYPNFEQDHGNPFSDYLCHFYSEIFENSENEGVLEVEPYLGADELPSYILLEGEMDKICAGNSLCREAIRWGDISIKDIPEGIQNDTDKFNAWVEEKASQTTKDLNASFEKLDSEFAAAKGDV